MSPFSGQITGNPRESRSTTDVCTLMEPTPDSSVSYVLMVAVTKASMMADDTGLDCIDGLDSGSWTDAPRSFQNPLRREGKS